MNYDEAISILAHRFDSPTVGFTEEYVEALHAIIADVIDSCALAARSHVIGNTSHQTDLVSLTNDEFAADLLAEDITMTVNDYVANHYGVEEFGL